MARIRCFVGIRVGKLGILQPNNAVIVTHGSYHQLRLSCFRDESHRPNRESGLGELAAARQDGQLGGCLAEDLDLLDRVHVVAAPLAPLGHRPQDVRGLHQLQYIGLGARDIVG